MLTTVPTASLAALAAFLVGGTNAHTWNEQFQVIENGKFVGDYGYPRGYFDKHGEPNSNESQIVWQIPQDPSEFVDKSDFACHPFQRTQNQTHNYPRIKATSGGYVAMKYLENGHITQPWVNQGKPNKAGTVFVYGTTQPKNDEKLVDVLQWTTDGQGGDKRGALLTSQNFDDGRCHQVNPNSCIAEMRMKADADHSMEQWCETDLHIPTTYKAGTTLSIYWLWQWSTSPTFENGKDQFYSTCSDFDIVAGPIADSKPVHTIAQQDPQTNAAAAWQSRTALVATPTLLEWDFEKNQKAAATPMRAVKAAVSVIPLQILESSACASASQAPAITANAAGSSAASTSAPVTTPAPTANSSTPSSAAAAAPTTGVSSMVFTAPSVSGMTASGVTTIVVTGTVTVAPTPAASTTSITSTISETTMVTVTAGAKVKREAATHSAGKLPSDAKSYSYFHADLYRSAAVDHSTTSTEAAPTSVNKLAYKHAYEHALGSYGFTFGRRHSRGFWRIERKSDDKANPPEGSYRAWLNS